MKYLLAIPALLLPLSGAAQNVKPIPPPGVEIPAADRAELEAGVKELAAAIAELRKQPKHATELPNVEIYLKAVDWALRYNEVFDVKQVGAAKEQIKQGLARAAALAKGETPWNSQTGLVARGYRSKIDGSVQPYGVLVPANFVPGKGPALRLDFWCHGRAEKLSELAFIDGAQKNKGEFTPEGAILCQLYGRYCNANKFAGEIDLFEALADIKQHYPIDEKRLVIRGFSMGGAACWQFATHFAGLWAAAAPGAGFAETAEFFKVFAPGKEAPPAWEQKLWRWYDCTTMAANLANTSTVAYSGEIDGQKQAADIMIKYAGQEGITFPHIIGPQTGHKYHPESKPKLNEFIDAAVTKGNEEWPKKVRFVTYTLIYPHMEWVTIAGLEKHWERTEVTAELVDASTATATTKNVAQLALRLPKGVTTVTLDGQKLTRPTTGETATFEKLNGQWAIKTDLTSPAALQARARTKHIGVCGPIDHAFMSKFVFIRPTGKPLNDAVGAWTNAEMQRAIEAWRKVFRGDVTVIDDQVWLKQGSQAGPLDVNIVLWGDPSSNAVLAQLAAGGGRAPLKLPLQWNGSTLALGTQKVEASHHVPILIYPNPNNPDRYVVINSGFTFREFALLNNSDQTPKLPDWAVVDVNTPPGPKWPGKVVDAGFFDEHWQVPK